MTLTERLAFPIATWFGAGYFPKAPGTIGTLGALPLYVVLRRLGPLGYVASTTLLGAAGVWSAGKVASALGNKDPQEVVIDEVVGTLIALGLTSSLGPLGQAGALCVFRLFDITKPGVIGRAEHLEPKGVGIMADDVLAGLTAGVLTRAVFGVLRLGRR